MRFTCQPLVEKADKEDAAKVMASHDPWLKLGRTYEKCLATINNPVAESYIMKCDDRVIGVATIQLKGALVGYIQTLILIPEFQGHTLGSQMITFLEKRIHKVSPNVFMCVSDFNVDALRLYKKMGFEVIGEIKNYIAEGHSELLLRKTIGALNDFKPKN